MKNLAQVLRERLSPEHLVELWLMKSTNTSLTQSLADVKESLSLYQEECDTLGISYAGSLTEDDTPTTRELAHALDQDHLTKIKEDVNPALRRSNFRYVEKQYNPHSRYTRYILANGGERIITDDELQDNPYLARQVAMSDAREEWDFDEYNRLKSTPISPRERTNTITEYEQCFVKIGTKLYGDVINLPLRILAPKVKAKNEDGTTTYENKQELKTRIRNYISMFLWDIKKIPETKIKIININKKCLQVI